MKTLFEFHCKSKLINVVKPILFKLGKYEVEFKPDKFDFIMTILSPGEYYTVPLEVAEAMVFIKEFMQFTHQDFNIFGGLEIITRIPENEDEKKKIGDAPHSATLTVQEVPRGVDPDEALINKMEIFYPAIKLLSQFNKAEKAQSQIDKYLNYFKIIEDSYYSGRNKLKEVLKSQAELIGILNNTMITKKDPKDPNKEKKFKLSNIPKIIEELVDLRDQCAHLRTKNNFGFSEIDLKSVAKLAQYVDLVRHISINIIDKRWIELDK